jgi:hypothetical protein
VAAILRLLVKPGSQGGRQNGNVPCGRGALILAGPACGKTTTLKQAVMVILRDPRFKGLVPIFIRTVELPPFLVASPLPIDVLDAYIASKYPRNTGTFKYLRQAMLERRLLVLLDGFDEAGSKQSLTEEFLRDQLLGQGFAVLFTSRYTGFIASGLDLDESFSQYEIKNLGAQQHHDMAHSQLTQEQAEVFLGAFRLKATDDAAFKEVGDSVHTYSMLIALFKRDSKFCRNKGELYQMILTGACDRRDDAEKQFVMDSSKVDFFRSLSLQSHTRTEQLRNISLKSIKEWGLPKDMWGLINEAEQAGRLPFWEPADEDPSSKEYRFSQITYQEYFVADLLVSEFVSKGTDVAGLLKFAGDPIGLFGVVKWHNIMKFIADLLVLQGTVAVAKFANYVFGSITTALVCPDEQQYKRSWLSLNCKNCGKSKGQHEIR